VDPFAGAAIKAPLTEDAGSPGPTWRHAATDCAGAAAVAKLKMTDPKSAIVLNSEGTAIDPSLKLHAEQAICNIGGVCTHLHVDENNSYTPYQY
jgi:hypothetical protein